MSLTLNIAKWYDAYQAPSVLMIDDLSDAYIDIYKESFKNDWGYMCDTQGGAFYFLTENLLQKYPHIKITFFVPYERHNVINESVNNYKKYAVGEREVFSIFLKKLINNGHEIAHHGSNHGRYIDQSNVDTYDNFIHEWLLYDDVDEGVKIVKKGIDIFKKTIGQEITGGKFCGYLMRENSLEIIDKSGFEYWCIDAKLDPKQSDTYVFGKNKVIAIPTNFNGNAFVRLQYKTGRMKKDTIKFFTQFLQPLYNFLEKKRLNDLYDRGSIISIQEHISPSTSSGSVQASNIVSDIKSLNKIFNYLSQKSIWYATCADIARYSYVREHCKIESDTDKKIVIYFNNIKNISNCELTLQSNTPFVLRHHEHLYRSKQRGKIYYCTVIVNDGKNTFSLQPEDEK